MPIGAQPHNILWRILDVQICPYSRLVLHEAEIPIWNIVMIKPFDRLLHGNFVKVLDEEAMRNDSNAHFLLRQLTQYLRCSRHRSQYAKQITLCHCELMQLLVPARRCVQAPFRQTPRDFGRKILETPTEPLGSNRTEATVKISAGAIKIDTENEGLVGHAFTSLGSSSPFVWATAPFTMGIPCRG